MKPGITVPACASAFSASARCKRASSAVERVDRVAHPEPEVGRHLVVARARGVQPAGGRPDQLGEPALDIHVDVLERAREGEGPRLDLDSDRVEPASDRFGVLRRR